MTTTTWDGAINLSDLGGVPIADGVTVGGRVFRSAAPEFLTDRGWADARAAGVTTVVDLRNRSERVRRDYHPVIDEHARSGIDIVHTPTEDPDDPEFLRVCGPLLDHPLSYPPNLAMYPERFAAAFRAIASADGAVLVHCAGGRDRTGMIAAILLRLAGADAEAIADNYEEGFRGAHLLFVAHPTRYPDEVHTPEQLDAMIADRRPALTRWIGSFDADLYLAEAGLTAHEIDRLTRKLRP